MWLTPFLLSKTTSYPAVSCSFTDYGYGRAAGGAGRRIDDLYAAEIAPRLGSEHYLDFTGSGLYFNSQIAGLAQVGSGCAATLPCEPAGAAHASWAGQPLLCILDPISPRGAVVACNLPYPPAHLCRIWGRQRTAILTALPPPACGRLGRWKACAAS